MLGVEGIKAEDGEPGFQKVWKNGGSTKQNLRLSSSSIGLQRNP